MGVDLYGIQSLSCNYSSILQIALQQPFCSYYAKFCTCGTCRCISLGHIKFVFEECVCRMNPSPCSNLQVLLLHCNLQVHQQVTQWLQVHQLHVHVHACQHVTSAVGSLKTYMYITSQLLLQHCLCHKVVAELQQLHPLTRLCVLVPVACLPCACCMVSCNH